MFDNSGFNSSLSAGGSTSQHFVRFIVDKQEFFLVYKRVSCDPSGMMTGKER